LCLTPSPVGEDGPDDAVVALADDESNRPRRREALLRPAARDEASQAQDLLVGQSAMGLPAAGRAYARDERPDRTDVCGRGIVNVIQVLFERPSPSLSVRKIKRRACPE